MSKRNKPEQQNDIIYYGYCIETTPYTEVTREADPNEDYDGDDTYTDWEISTTITPAKDSISCDVALPFILEENKKYYLVYIIYSDGDSFSSQTREHLELITVFTTLEKAQNLVEQIKEDDINNNSTYSFTYQDEIGKLIKTSARWKGYFNGIEQCEVHEVCLPTLSNKLKRML